MGIDSVGRTLDAVKPKHDTLRLTHIREPLIHVGRAVDATEFAGQISLPADALWRDCRIEAKWLPVDLDIDFRHPSKRTFEAPFADVTPRTHDI